VNEGVRAEVATGGIGDGFVGLLRTTARKVARGKPPPSGGASWTKDELDDLAFEMVDRVGLPQITLAASHAANDAEFSGYLKRALRTQLQLRARETPRGWVIARMDEALADDAAFVRATGRWSLAGHEGPGDLEPDMAELMKAAWAVETRTIRQDPEANKLQIAWRDDMRAVCAAVLGIAGSLPKATLGEVVAQRFNVSYASRSEYLDLDAPRDEDDDLVPDGPAARDERPADLEDEDAARWMLTQFTEQELIELRAAVQGGGSLRGIGTVMGYGKHKAQALKARVAAKLRRLGEEVGDEDFQASALLLRMVGHAGEVLDSGEDDGTASG
jgi:hypothetical protein